MTEVSSAEFPSVAVLVSRDAHANIAWIQAALGEVNERLFNSDGVIAPVIEVLSSEKTGASSLQLAGVTIGDVDLEDPAESVTSLLTLHAADLVCPVLVGYYLSRLRSRAPALAAATMAVFPMSVLVERLRAVVRTGRSIRDLSGVLNEELSAAALNR